MTYEETAAIVYRIISAYPTQTRGFTENVIKGMAREWHIGLENIPADGVMEAVSRLIAEQKWMPSLAEIIERILDIQYGTDNEIIRQLDNEVIHSSSCMIFGQVTEEQEQGYEQLSPFQKMIIQSPYEFSMWLMKDQEWKLSKVIRAKRGIQYGSHKLSLEENQDKQPHKFDVFKALEERKKHDD